MPTRNKEKTITKIINTSLDLFEKEGFQNASTEDIAKKAGLAHGTIFFYFSTKAELIINCIFYKMRRLGYKLDIKARETDNVRDLCVIFVEEVAKSSKFYARLVKDLPLLPMKVQRIVFSSLSGFSTHFVDVIEKGQRNGKIRQFNPKIAVFFWFGMINYIYSYEELLGTNKFTDNDKRELIDFFMNALSINS